MRKHILGASLLLFFASTCMTAAERKVSKVTSTTAGESYDYYLYNPQGQLMWVQSTTTNTRAVYSYNTKGQMVTKTTMSWIAADWQYKALNEETYTYGEDGNVKRMDQVRNLNTSFESKRYYLYTAYDEKGNALAWQHYNDKGVLYYEYKAELTFDDNGNITRKVIKEFDPDYPEDGWYLYEDHEYTLQPNGDINTEKTTVYKSDGSVKSTTDYIYTYSDLDASYAPTGFTATPEGNNIQLSWNAVEGATEYIVTYDMEHKTVSGTSFTAKNIAVGDHEFTIQAVIGGEEKNAASPITCALSDPGRLPVENLVAGTPRVSVEDTDEGTPRTFYIIPLSWEIPANHSEIKDFRVYYNSVVFGNKYTSVESKNATSFELKLDEYDVRRTDEDGHYLNGADMKLYLTVIYVSGESEASNIVTINPYNLINNIDEPDAIHCTKVLADTNGISYNLAGQKVSTKQKGIIVKNGRKMLNR